MKDKQLKNLIQKEIDGIISPEEKNTLQRLINESPEKKKQYEGQVSALPLLDAMSSVDPPSGIQKRIMNRLDLDLYPANKKKSRLLILDWTGSRKRKRAYGFSLGLAGCAIVTIILLNPSILKIGEDQGQLAGTIGVPGKGYFKTVEQVPIQLPNLTGVMVSRKYQDNVRIDVQLRSSSPYSFLLQFDPESVTLRGHEPEAGPGISIEKAIDYIKISGLDENVFTFSFLQKAETANVTLTLMQRGAVLMKHTYSLDSADLE